MGKTKKPICAFPGCKKRMSVVDILTSECKCRKIYCLIHRLPEKHACNYDYSIEVDVKKEIDKMKCISAYDKI